MQWQSSSCAKITSDNDYFSVGHTVSIHNWASYTKLYQIAVVLAKGMTSMPIIIQSIKSTSYCCSMGFNLYRIIICSYLNILDSDNFNFNTGIKYVIALVYQYHKSCCHD